MPIPREGDGMNLFVAPFRYDVTPPVGHSLCGGWIQPVVDVDDPLEAIGCVILGAGSPIVLCSVDWTGLLNSAHVAWREALADAAHTTPDRVAVQCVHQHNAPFVCLDTQEMVARHKELPPVVDLSFFGECLDRGRGAIREGLAKARPLTHIAVSKAKVDRVASNRRFIENDRVKYWRGSSCTDEALRALPEGLIDPWLRTVALYDKSDKVVSMHYYATHPMSYYGDGRVSSDFVGLARKRRQAEEPSTTQIYFTGCSGNIAAGKYNDGSKQARVDLAHRMFDAIRASEAGLQPQPMESMEFRRALVLPPARTSVTADALEMIVADRERSVADRIRSAMQLAWKRRVEHGQPKIIVSALHLGSASLIHLPSECFVEYQLSAQERYPGRFVATAAYGDGGAWYVPVARSYPQGGYEVGHAFCDPPVEEHLSDAVRAVMSQA